MKRAIAMASLVVAVLVQQRTRGISEAQAATTAVVAVVPASIIVEPDDGERPFIRYLDHAQRSIFLEAYILSDRSTIRALERARAQGVRVDVLLEHHPFGLGTYPNHIASELRAAGVTVRWTSSRFQFTHAKFIVIDDSTALVSTANFSHSAFAGNREVIVADRARGDVRDLSNIFRADWDRISPVLHAVDLVVSPVNARSKLATLISSARHSIDVYAEEMLDSRTESLLASRAHSGVRVRALIPPGALSARGAPRGTLARELGIHTLGTPYIHAKVIVVDGKTAFVGSENISSTSLDKNREVGLLITGPTISRLEGIFAADWKVSRGATGRAT